MKLFIDSGNIKDIEALAALGIIDGVTTNPSLLAKEPGDYRQNLKRICEIVNGPVSGEVVSTDFAGMIREGHDIAKIDDRMIVKVPLTRDGIRACKTLSGERIRVNVTLVFSAAQAQHHIDVALAVLSDLARDQRRYVWMAVSSALRNLVKRAPERVVPEFETWLADERKLPASLALRSYTTPRKEADHG